MAVFPPSFLDELRGRLTLSDVIGRRVRVVRAGREFKACCPFHQEKSPSFTINDQKGFFHCFGCGAHGDVVGFTMRIDHLSFPEAVEKLAGEAGLQIPKSTPELREREEKRHHLLGVIEQACKYFETQLRERNGVNALRYCQSRGLTEETLVNFRIGYAPGEGQALVQYLRQQKVPDDLMIEAGLARKSERDGSVYSFFRDRLLFPVTDTRGRVIAFGGRVLNNDKDVAKYINSADHPLFNKGHLLYNLARAQIPARAGAPIIIVEGYMDVIACAQNSIPNTVAPLGTALTEAQMMLAWKQMLPQNAAQPIVCFDGDNAGQRAAERALERALPILQAGKSLRFAFLPQGEDPDSILKQQGRAAFDQILNSAIPLVDFLWKTLLQNRALKTPEERAQLRRDALNAADSIKDPDVRNYYRQELLARLEAMTGKQNSSRAPFVKGQRPVIASPVRIAARNNKNDVRARTFLGFLAACPDLVHEFHEALMDIPIENNDLNQIREQILAENGTVKSDLLPLPANRDETFVRAQLHDLLAHWHHEQGMSELRQAARGDQANLGALAAELWETGQTKLDASG